MFDQYYWHNAISHVHILYNCLFYLVCMMGFLYVFEEYTHILISRQEKKVTFILSGIYTGIIWIAAGLIVYRNTQMLLFQLVTVAVTVILLEFYNLMIRDWLRKGTKKEKPRLLVLESTTAVSYTHLDEYKRQGYDYPGDVRTVDVHVRRLREKIEPNPAEPRFIHTKWGVGYYFKEV